MNISTAAIVNVVLDLSALGAFALVCRIPFRRAFQTAVAVAPTRTSHAEREQRAA
jgi:hypothetical protein